MSQIKTLGKWSLGLLISLNGLFLGSCGQEEVEEFRGVPLPVGEIKRDTAVTTFEFLGAVEGRVNVEIRPQVEGILDSIYVDEGDYVQAGQPLFKINSLPYNEQLKNAAANVAVEEARLQNAQIELERLQPLVDNEVISDVQLRTAESNLEIAKASLARSKALENTARINLNFTLIKAPVSGYIGRIPKRIGNLVAKNDNQPMTVLSEISDVFVYFAMSESDYLFFKRMSEDSSARRINPNVKLVLADGTTYDQPGKIDADAGQIDRSTGAIALRATFPNPNNLLRSGNTGKILVEQIHPEVIQIPQVATTVIQDKTFVFKLNEQNEAQRIEVKIEGKSGKNYLITPGPLQEGDRIILSGLDKISDGTLIDPMKPGQLLANPAVQ